MMKVREKLLLHLAATAACWLCLLELSSAAAPDAVTSVQTRPELEAHPCHVPPLQVNAMAPMRLIRALAPAMADKVSGCGMQAC